MLITGNIPLVFFTHPQSRGRVVRWMLEEIGCPYETNLLEYETTLKAAEYLANKLLNVTIPPEKKRAIGHGGIEEVCSILQAALKGRDYAAEERVCIT